VCWWIDVCWITHLWYSRCRATHTHTHTIARAHASTNAWGGEHECERDWVLYSYVWHDWFIYHSPSFFPLFLISPPPIPRLWGDYNVENRSIHRSLLQKNNIKSKVWDLWQMRAGNYLESNQSLPLHTLFLHAPTIPAYVFYGVATISRLIKIIGLFCKRSL